MDIESDSPTKKRQKMNSEPVENSVNNDVGLGCDERHLDPISTEEEDPKLCSDVNHESAEKLHEDACVILEDASRTSCKKSASRPLSEESSYFKCYGDLSIHRVMIEDSVRTQSYRAAILSNYKLFYKKVVADIGAGTGILSVFCAQAGAKKVYAVEGSSIAKEAEKVVAANGFSDQITVIHGKVEDITLPEKVDIIVSEWMGYMLMYESMLSSVLFARDKWLKEDGHIFPEVVKIHMAPISDFEEHDEWVDFCKTVKENYKIVMDPLVEAAERQMRADVRIVPVWPPSVQAHGCCIASLNLLTVDASTVTSVKGPFKSICFGCTEVNGFVVWFTAHFPNGVVLSTSPYDDVTHWEQSVLYINPVPVHQDTVISGNLCLKQNELFHRYLTVELEYQVNEGEKVCKTYGLTD